MVTLAEFQILDNLASRIAEQAHLNQKYGKWPYSRHLREVRSILVRFGYGPEEGMTEDRKTILLAAWLHDALEDTSLLREHIAYSFGDSVAEVVWRVTDEPGKTRQEKKLATYPKIKVDERALILKLADRIANVEASIQMQNEANCVSLFKMYAKEWQSFKSHLYTPGQLEPMWQHLDKLFSQNQYQP